MKKLFLVTLTVVICVSPVMANRDSLEKELEKELTVEEQKSGGAYKKLLISFFGTFGLSFPSGDIAGDGEQKALAAMGYSGGLGLCYRFTDLGGFSAGAEYAEKQVSTERSYMGSKYESTVTASTVNVFLGWRFILIKMLYIEPGLYYGVRIFPWAETIKYRGDTSERPVRREWTRDDAGVYLNIGVFFDVLEFLSIDVGLKMEASYLYSYIDDYDKLRTNLALLYVGVTFKAL